MGPAGDIGSAHAPTVKPRLLVTWSLNRVSSIITVPSMVTGETGLHGKRVHPSVVEVCVKDGARVIFLHPNLAGKNVPGVT